MPIDPPAFNRKSSSVDDATVWLYAIVRPTESGEYSQAPQHSAVATRTNDRRILPFISRPFWLVVKIYAGRPASLRFQSQPSQTPNASSFTSVSFAGAAMY